MRSRAHPTLYRGAMFRSRLEARWAAFFDMAGWTWEYEPPEVEGWSPDFALIGAKRTTLVEVKPINWFGAGSEMNDTARQRDDLNKVWRQSGCEILICGSYPLADHERRGMGPALGLIYGEDWNQSGFKCDVAILWGGVGRPLDFAAEGGSFEHRISGEHDGDHHLTPVGAELITELWNAAGRATQWRPAR